MIGIEAPECKINFTHSYLNTCLQTILIYNEIGSPTFLTDLSKQLSGKNELRHLIFNQDLSHTESETGRRYNGSIRLCVAQRNSKRFWSRKPAR